jgi:hypothetical protein
MKKSKLSLKKFKIMEFSNKKAIVGGTDLDPGGATQTGGLTRKKEQCIDNSNIFIKL